jgi:predicted porin
MKNLSVCIAVTALALAAAAVHAQSSVTVFGTVDIGIAHVTGDGTSRTGLSNSGDNISRLGFRGVEDLGGGLAASFWLEAGFSPDSGAVNAGFNRRSTVSLMGNWGEVRLGRDDSATFLNTLVFDPFLTNGVGGTNAFVMNGAPIQVSNAISYFLPPDIGGFYGQVQHVFGEYLNTASTPAGNYNAGRLGYRNGGLNVAVSTGKLRGTTLNTDVRITNLGASYDFGVAQPMLLWASEKNGAGVEVRALQLGVKVPVGAGEIRASAGRYQTMGTTANWRKFALGYAYNLSRRTQLYTTIARVNNSSGAQRAIGVMGLPASGNTLGHPSSGYEAGMRHFF